MEFLYFLSEIRNDFLDIFFTICTYFGEEVILVGIFAISFWCINKKLAYRIAFTYFSSGLIIQGIKVSCRIVRPWVRDPAFKPVESALNGATGYSFPSAHTQSSTSIYGTLALYFKKNWLFIVTSIIIALVMLSRMYLGYHTPADVCVGLIVTYAVAVIVDFISRNCKSNKKTDIFVMLCFIVASIIATAYSYWLIFTGQTTAVLAMDYFKLTGASLGFGIAWFIEKNYINFDPAKGKIHYQILKVVVGLAVALALKSGIKVIFGDTTVVSMVRYFVVIMWVACIYPFIIKKINEGHA